MTTQTLATPLPGATRTPILLRGLAMGYALLAYLIGASALFWVFFAAGGFAPYGLIAGTTTIASALTVNLGLVLVFALQHTLMARRSFKHWLTRFIPTALERATFVLMSGLALAMLVACWQDVPGTAWHIDHLAVTYLLYTIYFLGIVYVLASSLVTNHFELFGLRQAWLYMINKPYAPLAFKQKWMYRYSRHPMMLGVLMILWASPAMSVTRLVLAILLTGYVFAGIRFEERGLIEEFGDRYRSYQKQIGLFFTFKRQGH